METFYLKKKNCEFSFRQLAQRKIDKGSSIYSSISGSYREVWNREVRLRRLVCNVFSVI